MKGLVRAGQGGAVESQHDEKSIICFEVQLILVFLGLGIDVY